MRHLALIALAVLWVAPAQAETKEGSDGFGPIKFGMTKEEAWAAIEGKAEWDEEGRTLQYEMDIPKSVPLNGLPLKVSHLFDERTGNLAGLTVVQFEGVASGEPFCYQDIAYVVMRIQDRYKVDPFVLDQLPRYNFLKEDFYYKIFAFATNNGTSITVEASIGPGSLAPVPSCKITVTYDPPTPDELPF